MLIGTLLDFLDTHAIATSSRSHLQASRHPLWDVVDTIDAGEFSAARRIAGS